MFFLPRRVEGMRYLKQMPGLEKLTAPAHLLSEQHYGTLGVHCGFGLANTTCLKHKGIKPAGCEGSHLDLFVAIPYE